MIQQMILFNGFISSLPQKEAMMAEPGQEGKGSRETERVRFLASAVWLERLAESSNSKEVHLGFI